VRDGHHVSYLVSANSKNIVDSTYAVNGLDVESPELSDIPKFFYSIDARKKLRKLIEQERPDVAHLHIYYGQITPSILAVLQEHGIPVVQTLHEYKLCCPVSTMVRAGELCEECSGGSYWQAAWNLCNRGNLARSMVSAAESYSSDLLGARSAIDHFIAVSDFVRKKMIERGMPETRISTVHNFVRDDLFAENDKEGEYFIYVGRLEKIKGIETLIQAMVDLPNVDLYVVGLGESHQELEQMVSRKGLKNIRLLGFRSGQELNDLIAGAICLVLPSEWHETFGLALIESFAQGRPVIASRMGGMTEVVSDGEDGLLFDAGNVGQLINALKWMAAHRRQAVEMGKAGQKKTRLLFSADRHIADVLEIYRKAINSA